MIDVSLLSVMRRWYFRDGLSQREITKRTGLSRNTVRRYLKNVIAEPIYTKRQSLGKVDEFEELLISWLKREARGAGKSVKPLKTFMMSYCRLAIQAHMTGLLRFYASGVELHEKLINQLH